MLGNGLDFLISLIFLFFLFSILISAVMEAISSVFQLRGQALKVALQIMLDDGKGRDVSKRFGGFGVIDWIRNLFGAGVTQSPLFTKVFQGSLVGGMRPQDKPSYIEPRDFAVSLLAALSENKPRQDMEAIIKHIEESEWKGTRLASTLTALIADANKDYGALRTGIANWFDGSMMRLSGEYKRFTQLVTFLIALVVAGALNVDAIRFGERLLLDPEYAKANADAASDYVKGAQDRAKIKLEQCATLETERKAAVAAGKPAPAADASCPPATEIASATTEEAKAIIAARISAIKSANSELATSFPFIGREPLAANPACSGFWCKACRVIGYYLPTSISQFFGWLIMAMAAVMGAPFWFDLLQRFVNLRGTGPRPDNRTPGDGRNAPTSSG